MTFTPIGPGQSQAYRIASYLRRTYTEWTADLREIPRIPYLRWTDDSARASYQMLCSMWRIPFEA